MEFFKKLSELTLNSEVTINVTNKDGFLSMSIQVQPTKGNVDTKSIPYMTLFGPAEEVDEIFFKEISEPFQQAEKAFSNADEFKKDLADLKPKSSSKQSSGTTKKKVEKKKGPTAEEQLKKAEDLFTEESYKKALAFFEKALELSKDKKQKEQIKERISWCKVKIKGAKELKGEKEDEPEPEPETELTEDAGEEQDQEDSEEEDETDEETESEEENSERDEDSDDEEPGEGDSEESEEESNN